MEHLEEQANQPLKAFPTVFRKGKVLDNRNPSQLGKAQVHHRGQVFQIPLQSAKEATQAVVPHKATAYPAAQVAQLPQAQVALWVWLRRLDIISPINGWISK